MAIQIILSENFYQKVKREQDTVSKKNLYLKLDFKGDMAGGILVSPFKRHFENTSHSAKLHAISNKPVLTINQV